ncbi:MAG TPA: single-stranded DNA-binding protein [Oculatellaceae cyanobacterium]
MSFAKAVINGTLVADPEKRFTPNNHAVTSLTLSVENGAGFSKTGGNNDPFLVKVTCWRGVAEAVAEHLRKGDHVLVEGKLMMNSYQTQDGIQKKSFELEAASVEKLSGKPENLVSPGGLASSTPSEMGVPTPVMPQPSETVAASPVGLPSSSHFSSEELLTEDDIPF